jgi:hypothetical protein
LSVSMFLARLVVKHLIARGYKVSEKDKELCGYSR